MILQSTGHVLDTTMELSLFFFVFACVGTISAFTANYSYGVKSVECEILQ